MDDLVKEFIEETVESLGMLDNALVELERGADPDKIADIFRVFHTIKGTCGFLGLPRLEKVAHAAENVLDQIRNGAPPTEDAVSAVLEAVDLIKELTDAIGNSENGEEPEGDDSAIIDNLKTVTEDLANGGADAGDEEGDTAEPEAAPEPAEEPEAEKAKPGPAPKPEAKTAEPAKPEPKKPEAKKDAKPKSGSEAAAGVRVSVELLDSLMNLVGELVLARNQIQQVARAINVSDLNVPVQNLSHVASELQESVMKTRMQPVGNAWGKLPRIIRDLAKELDKKIDLQMTGEHTEIDKQVLELIRDPLTHMVRNCADHALETREERIAAGKPETGVVNLDAFHEGGHIVIRIADDGRGIPTEKVKKKAIERGIVTEEVAAAMSPPQIRALIFKPGFSTAEQVTSVSGRGVGMDVVRTNIEKIGGSIYLDSEEGKGSEFTIKIPLTLAIVAAFVVECGGHRFALPQINVREIVQASENSVYTIERLNGVPMLRLRDTIMPLVDLKKVLGLELSEAGDETVVVCQVGSQSFGIIVDGVLDTEEIVVKPLSPALQDVSYYSGMTILGDGSVIMIIDPSGVAGAVGLSAKGDGADHEVSNNDGDEFDPNQDDIVQMLVFTSQGLRKAVHLGIVARLEQVEGSKLEPIGGGRFLVQYNDKLMPVVGAPGWQHDPDKHQNMIVFMDEQRAMGLAVDEIREIVNACVQIDITSEEPGIIGEAIIGGEPTDIIDVSHFLEAAFGDWFAKKAKADVDDQKASVLLVDDSRFFRNMLQPLVAGKGYDVVAAEHPIEAFKILDKKHFDIIVSDIEMPEMDGLEFCRRLRKDPKYKDTPMIALSSHATPADFQKGNEAGYNAYMKKMDRDTLFNTLNDLLAAKKEG